ncbi:methyl-accepting chemotaxis protein [Streptomyces sp. NPDC058486]|uniref:methyl-accepting chemotaxis protein n=1 Tax=unclassified Streptomyces TaxID=2593676 RepID=UPI00365AF358
MARDIEQLSMEPQLSPRADELRSLAKALRSSDSGQLDPWTELDLVAAYARPESVDPGAPPREHAAWGWLETALGGLVFVPLALTWYGLTQASSAYGALTGANPKAATRPFLQLWQSGFEGHLTGFFTFGHVAGTATGAIVLLLVLAVLHGWRRARSEQREKAAERRAEALLRRMVPVLTRAQLCLHRHRLSSPVRFAEELTKSAGTLTRLGERASKTQGLLAQAAGAVGESLDRAQERLAGVDGAVKPLETAATRIEEAVNGGGVLVRQALEDVRGTNGEVRDVLEKAGTRVEDSVMTLAAAQRSFTTGIEVSGDLSGQVLGRLATIVETAAQDRADAQALLGRLADQADALTHVADRLGQAADTLATALARDAAGSGSGGRERGRRGAGRDGGRDGVLSLSKGGGSGRDHGRDPDDGSGAGGGSGGGSGSGVGGGSGAAGGTGAGGATGASRRTGATDDSGASRRTGATDDSGASRRTGAAGASRPAVPLARDGGAGVPPALPPGAPGREGPDGDGSR